MQNNKISFERVREKLKILADAAKYDASCSSSGGKRNRDPKGMGNVDGMGICHSYAPDGRCISLLKILLTNYCVYDCKFCVNRVSNDVKRARFSPEEVIWLTLEFYRRNYIEGLFLSSGIIGSSDETMELLIRVARGLREDHHFNGYVHLKLVAGATEELVVEAGKWADRVSANIEMPTEGDLALLAPAKKMEDATSTMGQVRDRREEFAKDKRIKFAPAGQTTQMVVGATKSEDREILRRSQLLYESFSLRRVYYSAYSPIPNAHSALPEKAPPLKRENRLYQADWLIRKYGFNADELLNEQEPNLSMDMDPKTVWAINNRHVFPVDLNLAPKEILLRVPGLGVRSVERLLSIRRHRKVRFADLVALKAAVNRAKYFVITADHNTNLSFLDSESLRERLGPAPKQLSLFEDVAQTSLGEI